MGEDRSAEGGAAVEPDPALDPQASARVLALADDPAGIDARLAELDAEWDIERVLEANAMLMSMLGTGVALARRRRLARTLPSAIALALLGLASDTVRPPKAVLRRLGFRSAAEIARERAALVALHGGLSFAPQPRPSLPIAALRRLRRLLRR